MGMQADTATTHERLAARERLFAAQARVMAAGRALWALPADASMAERVSLRREVEAAQNLHAIAIADVQRHLADDLRAWAA
jgi:hypothetical protein